MLKKLQMAEIRSFGQSRPEQIIIDFKSHFEWPKGEGSKGELIKDIVSIANSCRNEGGYIFFGIDEKLNDPVVGLKGNFDDASFQQLLMDKTTPSVAFQYYEIFENLKRVGVIFVYPIQKRPLIIKKNIGKLRDGQILMRGGSSTRGITTEELEEMFCERIRSSTGDIAATLAAAPDLLRSLQEDEDRIDQEVKRTLGLP